MERVIELNGARYVKDGADFNKQVNKVLGSIGEDMLNELTKANAIIAGGAVLSAFTHQDINDVDVYFRSKQSMADAFVALTKNWNSVYLGHTDKSITLKDRQSDIIVQFIHFDYFESAEAIFEAFDFTVCMAAIELREGGHTFVAHPEFISDMASRTLRFNPGTRFPYISLMRTKKYQEKGYKIGRGNLLAIANACSALPITSWEEAKTQLGGVYGNAIRLAVDSEEEFSFEKLHKVLTEISDTISDCSTSNYDAIYEELTRRDDVEIDW